MTQSGTPIKPHALPPDPEDDGLYNIRFNLLDEDLAITLIEKARSLYKPYRGDIWVPSDFADDIVAPSGTVKNPIRRLWKR
jgi:hypothetical protein